MRSDWSPYLEAAGRFCDGCSCVDCGNTEDNLHEVQRRRKKVNAKNPHAFQDKKVSEQEVQEISAGRNKAKACAVPPEQCMHTCTYMYVRFGA